MDGNAVLTLGVLGFLAFFGILFAVTNSIKKKRRAALESFAHRYGLSIDPQGWRWPVLSGEIDGRDFAIGYDRARHASGRVDSKQRALALFFVRLDLKGALPDGLRVMKRGLLGKAMTSDVETGDRDFDSGALVRCTNPEAAKAYLTPERRAALLRLLPRDISLEDGRLMYGPDTGKNATLEYLEGMSKPLRDEAPTLDVDTALPEGNLDMPVTNGEPSAAPMSTTESEGAPSGRHLFAAIWMGASAVIIPLIQPLLSDYYEFWFDFGAMFKDFLATGIVAFGLSIVTASRVSSAAVRGAVIGAGSWMVTGLLFGLFGGSIVGTIRFWFSLWGIVLIALSAVSGVIMSKVRGG
ncbi:MAG: hypothetical protein AAF436_01545 [Myxococcota bacterium]